MTLCCAARRKRFPILSQSVPTQVAVRFAIDCTDLCFFRLRSSDRSSRLSEARARDTAPRDTDLRYRPTQSAQSRARPTRNNGTKSHAKAEDHNQSACGPAR